MSRAWAAGTTRPDLHQLVTDLTEHTTHHTIANDQIHTVTIDPLLDQLAQAIGFSTTESLNRQPFGSRAAARLDAIDALIAITNAAAQWLDRLDAPDPASDKLRIQRLHSLTPQLDQSALDELTADIRHWWRWARILTGWDTPAARPNGTCPACTEPERGTLRVRLDEMLATCVKCRTSWDHATIGLLGEHIRATNDDTDDTPNPGQTADVG